jgi:hypothetical protein
MFGEQRLSVESETRRRAGREILDEDVGLRDQTRQDFVRLRVLDVEREAFFRAVEPYEIRRQAFDRLIVIAREIADLGTLDFDHARAEIGKLAGCERRRDRLLKRDYRNPV